MNFKKTAFMATIATIAFAPAAFAVNHDETFPRMLEMVTSASPAELDKIKDGFCKGQLAATMTASDIRGRAAELASDDLTEQQIFDLAGRVFKGSPAPTNLIVPPHKYLDENTIVIGEDSKGKA